MKDKQKELPPAVRSSIDNSFHALRAVARDVDSTNPEWRLVGAENGLRLWRKGKQPVYRASGTVEGDPEPLARLVFQPSHQRQVNRPARSLSASCSACC